MNERGAGRKPVLNREQILELKRRHMQGERVNVLAEEYGVSRQTISKYVNQKEELENI